ncbi:MAG: hypothetical protein ACI8TX_002560 [Hyphomicrobiaceae bacterium]
MAISRPANALLDKIRNALPWLAVVSTAIFALRKIDDFDTWWHLAAGRWIVRNLSVPAHDVLSFTVPDHEWLNLQWLYDVALYALWSLGGPNLLIFSSVVCFAGAIAVMGRVVSRSVDPVTTTIVLAWAAAMSAERFTVRPEMATFVLFAVVWELVSRARSNGGKHLWCLVPVLVLWANLHSLFVLGLALVLAHIVAAELVPYLPLPRGWIEDSRWEPTARKQLRQWGGAAVLATLINPYGAKAWLFPLELFSRIDGSSREVFQVIGEFRPPWSGYFPTFSIGAYQGFFVVACAVVVVAGLLRAWPQRPRRRPRRPRQGVIEGARFDLGSVAIFAALAWLSLLARRNVGVFAIGSLPVVAACLRIIWERSPELVRRGLASFGLVLVFVLPVGAVGLSYFVIGNHWYAVAGEQHEFGIGVFEENFPIYAAEFFKKQNLPGPLYNDMTAGGYLTWAQPTPDGVYVDGRLEVYDPPFFSTYLNSLRDLNVFSSQVEKFDIQSVLLFHRWGNRDRLISALTNSPAWALVYRDEVAIVFVRVEGNTAVVAAAREARDATDRITLERLTAPVASWQLPLARTYGLMAYGRLLQNQGERDQALDIYKAILALPLEASQEIFARFRSGALLAYRGDLSQARLMYERILVLQPEESDASSMVERIDAALAN